MKKVRFKKATKSDDMPYEQPIYNAFFQLFIKRKIRRGIVNQPSAKWVKNANTTPAVG